MVDMQVKLNQEAEGNTKTRGLLSSDPLQTFEIFITSKNRNLYDGYWLKAVHEYGLKQDRINYSMKFKNNNRASMIDSLM